MNKYKLYIIIFFLLLLVPLFLTERGHEVKSSIDNRYLKEFPDSNSSDFWGDFEIAFKDRIGLRSAAITAYTVLNDKIFSSMTHPAYVYGKDGYVFFHYGSLDQKINDYHCTFAKMLLKIQNYCKERGIKFYFMFEPEKKYVYERYLASGVKYSKDYWVRDFISYIDSLGINYVDNSDYLKEISLTEQIYNRKYDAGHWNDLGAFYGFNHLFERMHEDFPNVRPLTKDDFEISSTVATTLPVSYFPIHEEVPSFKSKFPNDTVTKDYSDGLELNKSFTHFHYYRRTDSVDLPRVLTFQGSYFNRKSYMIANSKEDIAVHNYQNVLNLDYYVNIFQPDAVVFEVAEYVFSDSFFDSERMKNLVFNPPLRESEFEKSDSVVYLKKVMTDGGKNIIFCAMPFENTEYLYLKLNGNNYDMKFDNNVYCTKNIDSVIDNPLLFVSFSDGRKQCFKTLINHISLSQTEKSNGVNLSDTIWTYTTNVEDNKFSWIGIQLHNLRTENHELISYASDKGCYSGFYVHNQESGEFEILIKANSNLSDEMIRFKVFLKEGEAYYYRYNVNSFSEKHIEVDSRFTFE
ncbi:MAG: hypothetical protein IKQ46_14445 [Bacteroidales bacterium]|nr:hypothetical protein [Bacteroidales bacterium]